MKKACLVVSSFYERNRIFDLGDKIANRDNCLYSFYLLRHRLGQHGFDLATQDVHHQDTSDIVIYNEMPHRLPREEDIYKSYLLIVESEVIRPDNWDIEKHRYFNKIFTWKDTIIDKIKYIKINIAQLIPTEINKKAFKKTKLCTLMAGNKKVKHPLEIYSKRLEAIRWFERNHPEDFDLYGIGWDGYKLISRKWSAKLNNILPFLTKYFPVRFPSYRGQVSAKRPVLEQYKFSICYENAKDIPGYITEKIFDCFFAGCVPVYWGANNITDHIPAACFIDKRKFASYEALYEYMTKMDDREYFQYLNAIKLFLKSKKVHQFSADYFANTIVSEILNT